MPAYAPIKRTGALSRDAWAAVWLLCGFLLLVSPRSTSAQAPRPVQEMDPTGTGERFPVPDPTRLTTQAVREAIIALKDVINTRLEGMDKALQLLQARSDRFPAELDTKISTVRDLLFERFKGIELQFEGIQLQFKERDTRVEQTAQDSKTAVAAALQAAKEAVEKQNAASSQAAQKSEGAFTKQIDQLAELFRTGTKSLEDRITVANKVSDDKLSAINERIARIESLSLGTRSAMKDATDNTMVVIAVIGGVVGITGVVITIIVAMRSAPRHGAGPSQ